MVSNVLEIERGALVRKLKSFTKKYAADPEYQKLRATLPRDWPF